MSANLVLVTAWLSAAILGLGCSEVQAAGPPFCPHINSWGPEVQTWATGAPWIKVLSALDAQRAKDMGSKVYYRPYDIPNHDDGGTGDGTGMAEAVLARLATIPQSKWPDAIGFRNEFGGTDTTTPQQFILYYDRLRAGGYSGWIVFGSYSTGVPESYRWSQSDVKNAVMKADAVETHEYFDLTEAFCHSWLACRHVRFINENPYLLGKPWFIGEAGSDRIGGSCHEDPCNRRGWRHVDCGAQKLTEEQYINELSKYRDLCAGQVVAVFIFQQGDIWSWGDFEVVGTSVGTWMQSTWGAATTGAISGNVRNSAGQNLSGAQVTTDPGEYSATTDGSGNYTISNVPAGTYSVTASMSGCDPATNTGVAVSAGQTTTSNFTLSSTPVSITSQPQSQLRAVGQSVVFSVGATGSPPLSYQWRKGEVDIPGAVCSSYSIHCAAPTDAGSYDCVVTNSSGSATSDAAVLTINYSPIGQWDSDKIWSAADYPTKLSETKWGLESDSATTENWGISYGLAATVKDRNGQRLGLVCDNNGNTSDSSKIKYRSDSGEGWIFDNTLTTAIKLGFYAIDSVGAYPALYIRTINAGVQIRYDDSEQAWVPGSYAVLGPGSPSKLPVPLRTWHYIRFQMDPSGNWDAWLNEDQAQHMWGTSTGTGGGYVQFGCLGSTSDNCEFAVDFAAWGQGTAIPEFGAGAISGTVRDALDGMPIEGAGVIASPGSFSTTTGPDGAYSLPHIPAGAYSLIANKIGYWPGSANGDVYGGHTTGCDISLTRRYSTVGEAKTYPDGSQVWFQSKPVTCVSDSALWIEENDRSAGIKVFKTGDCQAAVRDWVDLDGLLRTQNGERVLDMNNCWILGSFTIPEPLGISNRSAGGVPYEGSAGPNNAAMLVRVWGTVTEADDASFLIDDGSGRSDRPGSIGLKVYWPQSGLVPGQFVVVTGVVVIENVDGTNVPAILPRTPADTAPL